MSELQMDLFSNLNINASETVAPGCADISQDIRRIITQSIKTSTYSRWQIVARMSELLDKEVSVNMLNCWTAESKEQHRFPAEYVPAFALATGDLTILNVICEKSFCKCIKSKELVQLELGRLATLKKQIRDREKALSRTLEGSKS